MSVLEIDSSLSKEEWTSLFHLHQLHKCHQLGGKSFDSVPIRTYHHRHCPGISRSGLSKVRKSVAHYLRGKDSSDSLALLVGQATHTYVLEHDYFKQRYCLAPEFNRRAKSGKEESAAFDRECAEKNIISLSKKDYDQVVAMGEAVFKCPAAKVLLEDINPEVSYFAEMRFDHSNEKVLAKARPDGICKHVPVIVEFKTSSDGATLQEFRRSIAKYHYDMQAAMNLDIVSAVTQTLHERFVFIVAEKHAPFSVGLYQLDAPSVDVGRELYRQGLAKWHAYQQYPIEENEGLSPFVESINLPAYAFDVESR